MHIMIKVRDKVFGLQSHLEEIGIDRKSCHIDLVPENFIEDEMVEYI